MKHTRTLFALLVAMLAGAALRAQGTISLDRMDVMYAGVENPITVAWSGIDINDISVALDPKKGVIRKGEKPGQYVVIPTSDDRTLTLEVTRKIRKEMQVVDEDGNLVFDENYEPINQTVEEGFEILGSFKYRVKRVPNPIIAVNGHESGAKVCREDFMVGSSIHAMKDPQFDFLIDPAKMRVKSVECYINNRPIGHIEGSRLTEEVVAGLHKYTYYDVSDDEMEEDDDIAQVAYTEERDRFFLVVTVTMPDGRLVEIAVYYTLTNKCGEDY